MKATRDYLENVDMDIDRLGQIIIEDADLLEEVQRPKEDDKYLRDTPAHKERMYQRGRYK